MKFRSLWGMWITAWGLTACCGNGALTYDPQAKVIHPVSPEDGIQTPFLSVKRAPSEEWSYLTVVEGVGSYASNTKAIAVVHTGSDGSPKDRFVLMGDGRGESFAPFTFHEPITVKEIHVEGQSLKWPDEVFSPTYPLMPLSEVEAYIRRHKHLPGVPSAEEVRQSGFSLPQQHTILLRKVEELTLYVLALQKQVDSLKALHARCP